MKSNLERLMRAREETDEIRSSWFAERTQREQKQLRGQVPPRLFGMEPCNLSISRRPSRFLKDRKEKEADLNNFYTAITIRSPRVDPPINALGRNCVKYPQWGERRPQSSAYKKPESDSWEVQITKKVPRRDPMAIPVRVKTPDADYVDVNDWSQTQRTMFKEVVKLKNPPREFKVSPEWVSENEVISQMRAEKLMRMKIQA